MVPATIEVHPGPLPRNPNGKIDRKTLSAQFEERQFDRRMNADASPATRRWTSSRSSTTAWSSAAMPLPRLAARVGQTPFYAYDRALLTRTVAELRAALPREVELHYAMKANPMPALVAHMAAACVDGIDVASARRECDVALDAGMPTRARSALPGPGKSEAELEQAVAAGIVINMESEREMRLLAAIAQRPGPAGRAWRCASTRTSSSRPRA